MPRKPNPDHVESYLVPLGSEGKIDTILSTYPTLYNPKHLDNWKQKFLVLIQSIAFAMRDEDHDPNVDFINVNQDFNQAILGVDNVTISAMLKHLRWAGVLECDGKMIIAQKRRGRGGRIEYLTDGKSLGYRFVGFVSLVEVQVNDRKRQARRMEDVIVRAYVSPDETMRLYHEALRSVTVDKTGIDATIRQLLAAKPGKSRRSQEYARMIERIQDAYLKEQYEKNCIPCQPPRRGFLRRPENKLMSSEGNKSSRAFKSTNAITIITIEDMIVPCWPQPFMTVRKQRRPLKGKSKEPYVEDDMTTACRVQYSIRKINACRQIPTRPRPYSRVYVDVVRLNRELRKHIRIAGKIIIGLDIRNSQPLIASILINDYWTEKCKEVPDDAIRYRHACEAGTFYDHFMELNSIPHDMRSEFKADFFRRVFFSMVTRADHILKQQFIDLYPSCWEAICERKGGLFNRDYGAFARDLQVVEAQIMFDGVHARLLKMGIPSFNIFDSIYVGSMDEYRTAEALVYEEFGKFGIKPKINPEVYG